MEPPEARIRYTATAEDYSDALRHVLVAGTLGRAARDQAVYVLLFYWSLAALLGFVAGVGAFRDPDSFITGFFAGASFLSLCIALRATPVRSLVRNVIDSSVRMSRPHIEACIGDIELEFLDGAFRVTRDDLDLVTGWSHVEDVLLTDRALILLFKSGATLPIPRRELDPESFDAVAEQIEHYRGEPNVQIKG